MAMAYMRGRPRRLRLATNKQRRIKFRESLEPLGLSLEERLNQNVGTLSGGQRQALSLVMATISNPAILLLDEHIATLDPKTAQTVIDMTDMVIKRENMTAMMVTHNMDMALRYGNRLIMLHKGRILVDIGEEDKKSVTINNLVSAFERAAGEKFSDDNILLRQE
jgi:putative ABC transport system ATP-binding protein